MKTFPKVLLISLMAATPFMAQAEKFVLTTGEWTPYTGEKMPDKGLASEIVVASMKEMGDEVELKFFPWARAEEIAATDKTVIGTFPWAKTEARAQKFDYSELFLHSKEKLFYVKDKEKNINWDKPEDLKGYTFGGTRSYAHIAFLQKTGAKIDVADNDEINVKKLLSGRFQYFPISEAVGWDLIKTKFPGDADKLATVDKPILDDTLGIMVKKNDPAAKAFLDKFNTGFKKIKENGKLTAILAKYGLK